MILSARSLTIQAILSIVLVFGSYYYWNGYYSAKEDIGMQLLQEKKILVSLNQELEQLRKAKPLIEKMKKPKYPDEFINYKISSVLKLFNISIVNTRQSVENDFLIVKKTVQYNVSNLSGLNLVLNELFQKIGSGVVWNIESIKVNKDGSDRGDSRLNRNSGFHIIMVLNFMFSNLINLESSIQDSEHEENNNINNNIVKS